MRNRVNVAIPTNAKNFQYADYVADIHPFKTAKGWLNTAYNLVSAGAGAAVSGHVLRQIPAIIWEEANNASRGFLDSTVASIWTRLGRNYYLSDAPLSFTVPFSIATAALAMGVKNFYAEMNELGGREVSAHENIAIDVGVNHFAQFLEEPAYKGLQRCGFFGGNRPAPASLYEDDIYSRLNSGDMPSISMTRV